MTLHRINPGDVEALADGIWGSLRRADMDSAAARAQPGDTVVLESGEYDVGPLQSNTGSRYGVLLNPANHGVTFRAVGDVILRNSDMSSGQPLIGAVDRRGVEWWGRFCIDERQARAASDTGAVVLVRSQDCVIDGGAEFLGLTETDPYNFHDNHNIIRMDWCRGIRLRNLRISRHHQPTGKLENGAAIMGYGAQDVLIERVRADDVDCFVSPKGAPGVHRNDAWLRDMFGIPDSAYPVLTPESTPEERDYMVPIPCRYWTLRQFHARDIKGASIRPHSAWDMLIEQGRIERSNLYYAAGGNVSSAINFGATDSTYTAPKRVTVRGVEFVEFDPITNHVGINGAPADTYEDIVIEHYPDFRFYSEDGGPSAPYLTLREYTGPVFDPAVLDTAEPLPPIEDEPTPEPEPEPTPDPAPVDVNYAPSFTTVGGDQYPYKVLVDGVQVSQHAQPKEWYERAGLEKERNPDAAVIMHTVDSIVSLQRV